MPLYQWSCEHCRTTRDVFSTIAARDTPERCRCGRYMFRDITPAHVTPDIAPYIAVGGDMAGKPITSRREHREFLKRNRFTEVGNEPIRPIKNDFRPDRRELRNDIARASAEVLPKYRG